MDKTKWDRPSRQTKGEQQDRRLKTEGLGENQTRRKKKTLRSYIQQWTNLMSLKKK